MEQRGVREDVDMECQWIAVLEEESGWECAVLQMMLEVKSERRVCQISKCGKVNKYTYRKEESKDMHPQSRYRLVESTKDRHENDNQIQI